MAFPHPKSRKEKHGKEEIPNRRGVIGYFLKRTIDIADYGNAKDDVNPAKNGTFDGIVNHLIPFP
jgi:hypothetical protein